MAEKKKRIKEEIEKSTQGTNNNLENNEDKCHCDKNCHCEHECHCDKNCHCEHECHCDDDCDCQNDCNCNDNCDCEHECHCDKNHDEKCSDKKCNCHEPKVNEINLDYLDIAQRLKAEFDNYKKRNQEIASTSFNDGKAYVIGKLLPIIDAFDQANKTITDENVKSGVNIINNQLRNILTDLGVKKIECVGKEFDPYLHNAVFAVDSDGEKNIVLEELQEGFTLDGKVLRHSVVKISK